MNMNSQEHWTVLENGNCMFLSLKLWNYSTEKNIYDVMSQQNEIIAFVNEHSVGMMNKS